MGTSFASLKVFSIVLRDYEHIKGSNTSNVETKARSDSTTLGRHYPNPDWGRAGVWVNQILRLSVFEPVKENNDEISRIRVSSVEN